jgi:hypothetical protein
MHVSKVDIEQQNGYSFKHNTRFIHCFSPNSNYMHVQSKQTKLQIKNYIFSNILQKN